MLKKDLGARGSVQSLFKRSFNSSSTFTQPFFRIIFLILSITFMLAGVLSVADAAPAIPEPPKGYIHDKAELFSASQATAIEEAMKLAASENSYRFKLLVLQSLDGADPEQYSSQVYMSWQLEEKEVLLLLSIEEKRVELRYDSEVLLQAFADLSFDYDDNGIIEDKRETEFLNLHFVPYASKGDFETAVLQLHTALNNMSGVKEAVTATIEPSAEAIGTEVAAQSKNADVADPKDRSSSFAIPKLIESMQLDSEQTVYLLGVLAIVLVIGLIVCFLLMLLFQSRKRFYFKKLEELLYDANRALGTISGYSGRLVGKTENQRAEAEKVVSSQIKALEKLVQADHNMHDLRINLPAVWREYANMYKSYMEISASVSKEEQLIKRITDTQDELPMQLQDIKQSIHRLHQLRDKKSQDHGWNLAGMKDQLDSLGKQSEIIDQMMKNDPLESIELLKSIQAELTEAEQLLELMDEFNRKAEQFSSDADACQQMVERLAIHHNLQRAVEHAQLLPRIQEARRLAVEWKKHLQEGWMREVIRLAKQGDHLLIEVAEEMKQLVIWKESNLQQLRKLHAELTKLKKETNKCHTSFAQVQAKFVRHHWHDEHRYFLAHEQNLNKSWRLYQQASRLSEDGTQKLEEIHHLLVQVESLNGEVSEGLQRSNRLTEELNSQLEKMRRELKDITNKFNTAISTGKREDVLNTRDSHLQSLTKLQQLLHQELHNQVFDLKQTQPRLQQLKQEVHRLSKKVDDWVREKRYEENRRQSNSQTNTSSLSSSTSFISTPRRSAIPPPNHPTASNGRKSSIPPKGNSNSKNSGGGGTNW